MKYTTEYFIKKFSAIPESQWATGEYVDERGRMCALGHCGARGEGLVVEASALADIFSFYLNLKTPLINDLNGELTSNKNDILYAAQLGETPRERILNALILAAAIQEYGI